MATRSVNNNPDSASYDFDNLKKKPSRFKREFGRGFSYFVVLAAAIFLAFILFNFKAVWGVVSLVFSAFAPLIYGLGFAYLLNPLMKKIETLVIKGFQKKVKNQEKLKKISRGLGILGALAIVIAVLTLVLNMLIPELYKSIKSLIYVLPHQVKNLNKFINKLSTKGNVGSFVSTYLKQGVNFVQDWLKNDLAGQLSRYMGYVTSGVKDIVGVLYNVVIGLILSIYILNSKEKFGGQCKKVLYATTRPDKANFILSLTRKSNEIFGGFLIGKIIDSIIIGILCFVGISIFGITQRYALLVSVIVGVTNVIPFFGPYLGAIPSTLLIVLEKPIHGLYFLIFILVLQQIDGNVLGAKILGNSTGLSTFWVVFAIVTGGSLFGFVGMIIGVPTFAVIYYIFRMIIDEKLKKKNMPVGSNSYINAARMDVNNHTIYELPEKKEKEQDESIKEFIANKIHGIKHFRHNQDEESDARDNENKQ